jgi:DNA replication protein DnaC
MAPERPPAPPMQACIAGCGGTCPPVWINPIPNPVDIRQRPLVGTGVWAFDWETCPACEMEQQREQAARAATRADRERRTELLAILGGEKAETFTLDAFKPQAGALEALQEARAFHPKRSNLYLWGPCGTGKTHLASGIAAKWFWEGARVDFWKPPALMRHMRVKEADEQERRIERASTVPLFVLDDLGVGMATEFYNQILWEIIDNRDMTKRNGLIITSNLSLAALAEKLGDDRLPSRIEGLCKIVKIEGKDYRQEGRKP